ncbi:BPSL0761 family protein [Pseudoxanthomonas mexicana]|uniref:BPSL0761 family protein n=1 Tax=Pseudoxanthomonas mexicana TaxID=128785 RepID=UPI003084288B
MTTPTERTRALLWAGSLLVDLSEDETLPLPLRRRAVTIARHFPTIEDVSWITESLRESVLSIQMASPEQVLTEESDLDFAPLRHSTRLRWPDE